MGVVFPLFASIVTGLVAHPLPSYGLDCALPVVVRAAVRDIHESWWNGPIGYGFVEGMGGEKSGDLPARVGRDPERRFDSDVYASNFQGPVAVQHPNLRQQWEWTAAGSGAVEVSQRSYPLMVARRCSANASTLPEVIVRVGEHDEWPLHNDGIGSFAVELNTCAEVLGSRRSGWTAVHRSEGKPHVAGSDASDIAYVDWLVWCYRCDSDSDCEDGIVWSAR
ncbi:MAG TPA: hypothetical protein VEB21_17090 [Terriglobales bacterium]|nr:hypothetical protein [Terriglobales bacterium]